MISGRGISGLAFRVSRVWRSGARFQGRLRSHGGGRWVQVWPWSAGKLGGRVPPFGRWGVVLRRRRGYKTCKHLLMLVFRLGELEPGVPPPQSSHAPSPHLPCCTPHLVAPKGLTPEPCSHPHHPQVDDGLSLEELPGGGVKLWVHVADPTRWVEPGEGGKRVGGQEGKEAREMRGRGWGEAAVEIKHHLHVVLSDERYTPSPV